MPVDGISVRRVLPARRELVFEAWTRPDLMARWFFPGRSWTVAITAKLEVGGYTDNVGGDAMNQKLSENRAGSVRDYLVQEGVSTSSVTAQGYGNSLPVASNNNAAGRQQNRRVELLVSGEAIGHPVNTTTGSLR